VAAALKSLVTKDISSFAAIIKGLNLPLLLLAGVLQPISLGPPWMRILAHVNPFHYLVPTSRALALGSIASALLWQAFAVLAPSCALVSSGQRTCVDGRPPELQAPTRPLPPQPNAGPSPSGTVWMRRPWGIRLR
jgi:ABC-2 type transporter